ncbi:hypothetical protein [Streptomyces sp. Qhu_M48]
MNHVRVAADGTAPTAKEHAMATHTVVFAGSALALTAAALV